jgi:hypothetical protein
MGQNKVTFGTGEVEIGSYQVNYGTKQDDILGQGKLIYWVTSR